MGLSSKSFLAFYTTVPASNVSNDQTPKPSRQKERMSASCAITAENGKRVIS